VTEVARAARPPEPRYPHSISWRTRVDAIAGLFDAADDLVTRNERKRRPGQVAVDDVQIGATDGTGKNTNQDLRRTGHRPIELDLLQSAGTGLRQHHRSHDGSMLP
jgi:hypothetical protein